MAAAVLFARVPPARAEAAEPAKAAPVADGEARPDRGDRAWPVEGAHRALRPVVVRGWELPPEPWAAGHRGVDLTARPGQAVRAAAPGRVVFAGKVAGRGVISVQLTGSGSPPLRTTYEPVRPSARKGDRVSAGEEVGRLAPGPFHCEEGCLHWGLLRGDRYLDPLSLLPYALLRGGAARLLPVFGVPLPPSRGPGRGAPPLEPGLAHASAAGRTGGDDATSTVPLAASAAALCGTALWAHARLVRGCGMRGARAGTRVAGAGRGRVRPRPRAGTSTAEEDTRASAGQEGQGGKVSRGRLGGPSTRRPP
ncbi:M23 family metallopeptidase [Streptomyces daliensis]|uniref:M23 family metallopeptidase n=1 Tax=Streptomyces daliensis TaxID=299421 RepID=A0A8T4IRB0_9ACTN|nr:M23 family metallopeptidase [Streptomyces daliensis]